MIANVLQLELIMVLLIGVGMLLCHKGKITDKGRECLMSLMMDVILPCNIFNSFYNSDLAALKTSWVTVLLSVGAMMMATVLGKLLFGKMPQAESKVLRYGIINSSALFVGLPVIQSLLGDPGAVQQNVFMVFMRVYLWTYALAIFTGGTDWRQTVKSIATNPCMIASYLGIGVLLLGIRLPVFMTRTITYFSSCLMAVSMMLIGCILYGVELKKLLRPILWYFSFVRLLLIPAITLAICTVLHIEYVIKGTVVLLSCMPAASLTAVLPMRYGGDAELGGLVVTLSTALSILTIPVWFLLLQM